MFPRARFLHRAFLVTVGVLLLFGPARAAGLSVALGNSPVSVIPGAEFDLDLLVTAAGHDFNGFDAVIGYDPAALTFMPATPLSAQQGCLMTGGCSAACGTTFHTFNPAGDSLRITDVLLCDQVSLNGPGQVYRLHFKASLTPQTTHVRFRSAVFYDAGVVVSPLVTTDADIVILAGVGVDDRGPLPARLTLSASPEPARGPLRFAIASPAAGPQQLEVHDITGRRVRRLASGWQPAGAHTISWDGRDESGARLPPGVYLATLRTGDAVARTRVTLLY